MSTQNTGQALEGTMHERSPGNMDGEGMVQQENGTSKVQFLLYGLILLGLGLAMYNGTWQYAITISLATLVIYLLTRTFFAALEGYVLSLCLGLLSSQIVFQMKGQPHFLVTFLVVLTAMVFFKNWKTLIPITLIFILHLVAFYFMVIRNSETAMDMIYLLYIFFFILQAFTEAILMRKIQFLDSVRTNLETRYSAQNINLERNINFARQIASGNFETNIETSDEDVLGKSLAEMNRNLKAAAEENRNRNWTMVGIARIAEIIRVSNHKMEDLANQIVAYLVKYLNACQGGIFVLNDSNQEDQFLELKGCYAYDRKKYLERKVEIGEGLIGQAVMERETTYLKVIPQDYLHITSGLGHANPNTLIIVPLKTEDQVVGALEIASFNQFADYQREFLEKVSENIASSIIFTKNQDKTTKLLQDSQVLGEQLRAQEEEMRQNMEELQATQEDLQRKNSEMENAQKELTKERYLLEALMKTTTDSIYFKDLKSRFIRISNNLAKAFGVNDPQEVVGKSDFDFFTEEHARPAYEAEQEIIRTEKPLINVTEKETWEDGRETYVSTSKMPLRDLNNNIVGTFGISRDVTEAKRREFEVLRNEKLYNHILRNSSEIFFAVSGTGKISYVSPSYFRVLKTPERNLTGFDIQTLIHNDDISQVEKALSDVTRNAESTASTTLKFKKGSDEWVAVSARLTNYLTDEDLKCILFRCAPPE